MNTSTKYLAAFLGFLNFIITPVFAEPKVDETEVGPVVQDAQYVTSPQGSHLATITRKGSRKVVMIDGVAGPKFDEVLTPSLSYVDPRGPEAEAKAAGTVVPNLYPVTAVIFSKDGKHFAYLGRQSEEWVFIEDNKELLRLPKVANDGNYLTYRMQFTGDDGRHLLFARSGFNGYELWVDGQKWPGFFTSGGGGSEGTVDPIISPDGNHVAYVAQIDRDKRALILDGKDTGYFGYDLRFSPDSQHLICTAQTPKGMSLLVDGKSRFSARQILAVYQAPAGDRIGAVLDHKYPDGSTGQFLLMDGKPVETSLGQQVKRVVFSPDGKRYAAICGRSGAEFVVTDGKKGQEYFSIDDDLTGLSVGLSFSADSAKVGYVANANNKKFIIINDDESDEYQNIAGFLFSPDGKHVVTSGMRNIRSPQSPGGVVQGWPLSVDGKAEDGPKGMSLGTFTFSPDSSHHACFSGSIGMGTGSGAIFLDGKDTGLVGNFTFSPDSKHFAVVGYRSADNKRGLFVDGQFVFPTDRGIRYRAFTPDSQHLFWMTLEAAKSGAPGAFDQVIYLDGKPVARCDQIAGGTISQIYGILQGGEFIKTPPAWSVGSDGVLTFLGPVGDVVKRFSITPSPETSVATLLAAAHK